jgi:hypothetical protein
MQPKIALETPFANLDLGFKNSDYIFALAHLWSNKSYRAAVRRWKAASKEIYLDNSAFELSKSISNDTYIEIINDVRPDVIVVPDALGNFSETVKLARSFYISIPNTFYPRFRFMVVLQGRDNRERMKCFHTLKGIGFPFHIIGLPRHAYPHRVELLHNVMKFTNKSNTPFHFLGVPDPEELRGITPLLESLDTSWVAKDSIGKGGFDSLDFEHDVVEAGAFAKSLEKFHSILNYEG